MERTNIGDVVADQLHLKPTLATVDLSYLSLTQAIPIIRDLLDGQWDMLCLVKPLFEVKDSSARRTGVISDPSVYRVVLSELVNHTRRLKLCVRGITHSHVTGNAGTSEFFMWISEIGPEVDDFDRQILQSVERVLRL